MPASNGHGWIRSWKLRQAALVGYRLNCLSHAKCWEGLHPQGAGIWRVWTSEEESELLAAALQCAWTSPLKGKSI